MLVYIHNGTTANVMLDRQENIRQGKNKKRLNYFLTPEIWDVPLLVQEVHPRFH